MALPPAPPRIKARTSDGPAGALVRGEAEPLKQETSLVARITGNLDNLVKPERDQDVARAIRQDAREILADGVDNGIAAEQRLIADARRLAQNSKGANVSDALDKAERAFREVVAEAGVEGQAARQASPSSVIQGVNRLYTETKGKDFGDLQGMRQNVKGGAVEEAKEMAAKAETKDVKKHGVLEAGI